MDDHDQRFKTLLREFIVEFFLLFFPTWAERFDFTQIVWLKQEVFPDPPQGERGQVDLVCQVGTRQVVPALRRGEEESSIALIHVEIERPDTVMPLRGRMFDYYTHFRREYRRPVLPIALYLQVGLEGIGIDVYEEHFWEAHPVHFEYYYVGLPALDAETYLNGANWLGVALAALMRCPRERRAWVGAEAIRRVVESPLNVWKKYLLCECVQAYAPLDKQQKQEFDQLLLSESYAEVKPMNLTWTDQGRLQGQRRLLLKQLEKRFGALSPQAQAHLESWPLERLEELGLALLEARSLQELGLED